MRKYIIIQMTDEEKQLIKKDAHKHEMNVSEYVRWLIEKQRGEDKNGHKH